MASGALEMSKCFFCRFGHCQILKNTACSNKCKFKKTEDQYFEDQCRAEEMLKARGLKRAIVQTPEGPIITVKSI